jgi:hypothetical protein
MKYPFSYMPLLGIIFFTSCGLQFLKEQKRIDMTQVNQFQDSIPHIISGVRSIHTIQDDDASKVTIIVGAPSFYNSGNDKQQQAAIRTGMMVLHVLGPDNSISKATLVLSKKDSDEVKVPADGIILDMRIDSLRKVIYPAK